MLLYKHLYCLVLSLSRALSLSVIDHLCVLLQTAWGVRPSCRAAHHARVRLPRRRGFPAARVRVHCRSLHQGAAPRSDFTASCARSHARTLARTHTRTHARTHALALSCMHTCMHERTHAHDPRTLPTHIPTQRTHTSRALLRAINSDGSDRQLRGMLPLMTSRTVDSGCRVAHYARTRHQRDRGRRRVLLRGPPRRQQRRAPARPLHRRARKMNDCVRDEIWVTVPVTGGPREFVRSVELSELCLLMCPSPPCEQLPA